MAQPDASVVWIQYMAFLISLGEVEKARGLAERAVQTINYRWGKSHPDHCVPVPVVMQCSGFPGGAEEAGLTLQALNHRSGWLAALHVGCLWTAQWVCASWLLGHPPHAQELRQACIMLLVVDSHQKGMVYSGKQTTHDNSMPQAPCRQEREGCSWFPALSARPQTSAGMDCVPPWCRQEQEKFNIWVAWLNLESKYGDPTPEEALTRLFQRGPDLLRPEEAVPGAGRHLGPHWAGEAHSQCSLAGAAAARCLLGPRWKEVCMLCCLCYFTNSLRSSVCLPVKAQLGVVFLVTGTMSAAWARQASLQCSRLCNCCWA